MGSTLGTLKTRLNFALGTSETNLYTNDKRTRGINRAIETILEQYQIPQYVIDSTLSLSSGSVALPTDCLRVLKLWNSTNSVEYGLIIAEEFDLNQPHTCTIKWDTVSSAEKIYIYPSDTVNLSFRYLQMFTYLSDDGDTTRFATRWDDAIAELAAHYLFTDAGNYDSAGVKKQTANDLCAKAWQIESARYQAPAELRLESVFTRKKSLLRTRSFQTSTALMGTQNVAWTTITTDTNIVANYGYICDSASLITLTLPATASVGDVFEVAWKGVGGWKIAQNAGQSIRFGASTSTTGTGGYITGTANNASCRVVCISTNLIWEVVSNEGTISVV